MSKLVLFGTTALEYYAHVLSRPANAIALGATDDPSTLAALAPLASGTAHIGACFPHLTAPYHVTVFSERERRQKVARCHVAPRSLRAAPFFPIAHGIYAPSPELALLESSRGRAIPEVAYGGALLCGTFALSENGGAARPAPLASNKQPECTRMSPAAKLSAPPFPGYCRQRHRRGKPPWRLPSPSPRAGAAADCRNLASTIVSTSPLAARTSLNDAITWPISAGAPSEFEKVAVVVAKALRRPLRIRTQDFHARQRALWRILRLSFAVSEPDERTFSSSPEIAHSPQGTKPVF